MPDFSVLASVLYAFFSLFPNSQFHWLVIDLAAFSSFNKKLLLKLYDQDKSEVIESFWTNHSNQLQELPGNRFCLDQNQLLVVNRLQDLTSLKPSSGVIDNAKVIWETENVLREKKLNKLKSEESGMTTEFNDFKNQIEKLDEMLSSIVAKFRNEDEKPARSHFYDIRYSSCWILGLSLFSITLEVIMRQSDWLLLYLVSSGQTSRSKSPEGALGIQSNLDWIPRKVLRVPKKAS